MTVDAEGPVQGGSPEGAKAAPAPAEGAPPPAPSDAEALARAEREAAEALQTGAFDDGGSTTQRVRRDDVMAEAGLAGTPLGAPLPEAAKPAAAEPAKPAELQDLPPTEKFDRDSVPTEGKKKDEKPAAASSTKLKARTEEDDRLVAALLFLTATDGAQGTPSPFATVGGVSLLKRAAASCKLAKVPRVLLGGENDKEHLEKVRAELAAGGWDGPVDVWDGGGPPPVGERGRVLILDASGVHDPEAVARLARWKGERAYVLVSPEGDGLRVQVEGNRVREVGTSLVPFDGVTCGAVNVPLTLFPRLSEFGALSALVSLASDGLLGASVEHRTFAREIGSETGLSEARARLLERAAGGPHDTLLNRLLLRRLSRPLTQALLPLKTPPWLLSGLSVLVGLGGAGLLTGIKGAPGAAHLLGGAFLIVLSTVLDCVAYELRSFAIQPGGRAKRRDLVPHGLVAAAAVAAIGWGAQQLGVESGFMHGLVAAGGAGISTLLLMLARSDEPVRNDPASMGIELLSRRLVNREIGWVLLALVVGHLATRIRPAPDVPPSHEVLDHGLVGLAALTHSFWVALAFFLILKPRKR